MKLAAALISLALTAGSAFAATENKPDAPKKEPSAAQKAQQDKMKACNAQATGKKGDERKAFMKECLGGGAAASAAASPACDAQATEKKLAGAAKASFLKKCQADTGAAAPASAPAK